MISREFENAEEGCRLCGGSERCSLNRGRLLGCLNLCLVVTALIYVTALHREVSGIRTDLGRCNGDVQTPPNRGGDQIDIHIVNMEEYKTTYTGYGNGEVTDITRNGLKQHGMPDRHRRASYTGNRRQRKQKAKKNRKRHRKQGIKALHMAGNLPLSSEPTTIPRGEVRYHVQPQTTVDGYKPPEDDKIFRHWEAAQWAERFSSMYHYDNNTGQTTVKEDGIYLIYSQITTSTEGIRSGYSIYIDNVATFTCVHQKPAAAGGGLYSDTCSTSGVVALRRSQTISIGVAYEDVRAFMKPRLSFWGMIRLTNYPKSRE